MIARSRSFAAALGVALVCFAALSFAEGGPNTTLQASYVLWPDGMATTDSLPPSTGLGNEGTPQWFRFGAGARRSYSVEIFQLREDGFNSPAQATLSQAFSDLAGSVAVPFTDYSFADPSGGDFNPPSIRRYSIRDRATGGPVFLKVVSGLNYETNTTQTFRIRVFDTTLVGTRVSTVGYDAFVMLHNSGDYQVSASVHFYDEAGTFIGTQTRAINARGSVQLRYAHDDPTYGNLKGSVEVTHNGAPGSVVGHLYSFSFGLSQPGPQIPLLDSRSWGRGAY
jgi:hypothetical protein